MTSSNLTDVQRLMDAVQTDEELVTFQSLMLRAGLIAECSGCGDYIEALMLSGTNECPSCVRHRIDGYRSLHRGRS